MVASGPGFLPKTALVASRAVYYPFTIPQKLDDSATLVGHSLNGAVAGVTAAIGQAYVDLKPRGPAKWLIPVFQKTLEATQKSEAIAARNKTVFWDPFSAGAEGVGRAIASPGAYWYLKKAGVEQPTQDMIKGVLGMGLFKFPQAAPAGEGAPAGQGAPQGPPAEQAPAPDAAGAAQQAAEGAGQTQAA